MDSFPMLFKTRREKFLKKAYENNKATFLKTISIYKDLNSDDFYSFFSNFSYEEREEVVSEVLSQKIDSNIIDYKENLCKMIAGYFRLLYNISREKHDYLDEISNLIEKCRKDQKEIIEFKYNSLFVLLFPKSYIYLEYEDIEQEKKKINEEYKKNFSISSNKKIDRSSFLLLYIMIEEKISLEEFFGMKIIQDVGKHLFLHNKDLLEMLIN